MILVILLWILVLFIFITVGYSAFRLIGIKSSQRSVNSGIVEYFFTGFLTLSVLTGYLSILIPIGTLVLIVIVLISLLLFVLSYRGIMSMFKQSFSVVKSLSWREYSVILFILLFVLFSVAQPITWGDTESYHVQAIKWIRQYAVVPGLGNIHGRFAFNSMFFVISGLFSFRIGETLLFPLNGICFLILATKLVILFSSEIRHGAKWKAVFYGMILLISLMFLIPSLNSPSADAICAIIIMYLFILLVEWAGEEDCKDISRLMLIYMLIFSCIAFKLSSFFVAAVLILLLDRKFRQRGLLAFFTGIIIIIPFIVRNYFLSGYLAYPFPAVDVFNVDWKIPFENVQSMKLEIEGWAKISTIPYPDVVKMGIGDWIVPWFKSLGFNDKLIVTGNFISIILFIAMLFKRDLFLAKVQLVLILNLVFWLFMAPDIRFAYGFLFTGFSLAVAYIIKLFEDASFKPVLKLVTPALICVLILGAGRRIEAPADTLIHPSLWVVPAPFGSVETEVYATYFEYRVPVERGGCLDTEIPCVPFPFDNILMRGNDIQDGFRVDTTRYSGIHYID